MSLDSGQIRVQGLSVATWTPKVCRLMVFCVIAYAFRASIYILEIQVLLTGIIGLHALVQLIRVQIGGLEVRFGCKPPS